MYELIYAVQTHLLHSYRLRLRCAWFPGGQLVCAQIYDSLAHEFKNDKNNIYCSLRIFQVTGVQGVRFEKSVGTVSGHRAGRDGVVFISDWKSCHDHFVVYYFSTSIGQLL